jgi:hypothetical protein
LFEFGKLEFFKMVATMDSHEAVISLDAYSHQLVSLSRLVENAKYQDDSEQAVRDFHATLKRKLIEKQKEAMQLAGAVVGANDLWATGALSLADSYGIQEAVGRYVLADRGAAAALEPLQMDPRLAWMIAMDEIRAKVAARDKAAEEAKAEAAKAKAAPPTNEAAAASSVSPATVHDAAAGHPELPGNP